MRVLSAGEVADWFRGFENLGTPTDYVHADKDELFFTHPEASCIDLEYPLKLEQLPFFAHLVATIGYEDQHFDGALLWITQWGVWNLFGEGIGYRIVERMNAAAGQPKSFEVAPGHQFRQMNFPMQSECCCSPWYSDGTVITCRGGHTVRVSSSYT